MNLNTRRTFFSKLAALSAFFTAIPKLFAQQTPPATSTPATGSEPPRRTGASHVQNGIYYFSGTGSNDGYPKEDHILVADPFEKHVTRTMDAWIPGDSLVEIVGTALVVNPPSVEK